MRSLPPTPPTPTPTPHPTHVHLIFVVQPRHLELDETLEAEMLGFGRDALRVQPVCVADSGSLAQYRQGDSVAAAGVEIKGVSMTTTAAVGAVMVLGTLRWFYGIKR